MATGKCSNPDCVAPISCHLGKDDYKNCPSWAINNQSKVVEVSKKTKSTKKNQLTWTGKPMMVDELPLVGPRNMPVIIGVIGKADAGKTTYLAMLFTLLLQGKSIPNYKFAGSKTILGWDELYHTLKVYNSQVEFPEPTPLSYNRLHHIALRGDKKRLVDLFFSDASGEVFSRWSQNRNDTNADNARWIYQNSQAFMLFVDCDDLVKRKNQAKTEIIDIAEMLRHDLRNRPVITLWSKADKKSDIHPLIISSLSQELSEMFPVFSEIDISNFSMDDPDDLVHSNNIKVVDWLLNQIFQPTGQILKIKNIKNSDPFFNYKDDE
ncbi:MAG: hypothetical protein WC623_15385 [Pedobacter sp.]|uniref:TRAFAC clade GTPase domain-containing protein n=1 Tax=Pedobacter sp. TaxID=1411316 RepID=UPI003568D46B